jgi:hypothetical protein
MANTSHLAMTLVETAQSQKEVTVNEALTRIDAILNCGAIALTNTPPGSPLAGNVYILRSAPTGVWNGQANKIAYYTTVWNFITPLEGMSLWVNNEDCEYFYNGSAWVAGENFTLNLQPNRYGIYTYI